MKTKLIIVALLAIGLSVTAQKQKSYVLELGNEMQKMNPTYLHDSDNDSKNGYCVLLNVSDASFKDVSKSVNDLVSDYSDIEITDQWYKDKDGIPTLICDIKDTDYSIFFHYFYINGRSRLLITVYQSTPSV